MSKRRAVVLAGSLMTVAVLVFLVFSFVLKHNPGPNPVFFTIRNFPELVTIPADSVYGSTIDLWVYQTEEGDIDRVIETGHADSLTCSRASAALITTWLGMHTSEENLLAAGIGYLEATRDPDALERIAQLKEDEHVQKYLLILHNSDEPSAELLQNELVQEFRNLSNQDELTELVKTFRALEKESGLVAVHTRDASQYRTFETAIEEHMQSLTTSGIPVVVDLMQTDAEQLPVVVPFYYLNGSGILRIELDTAVFQTKDFPELAAAHSKLVRDELEREARRRLLIYKGWLADDQSTRDQYSNQLSKGIDERVHIWFQRQYNPPTVQRLLVPETMQASEYLPSVLDPMISSDELWITKMEEILALITDLQDSPERLDSLNFAILVDSFLRDWQLAFTQPLLEQAYRSWVKEARGKVWDEIEKKLEGQGVSADVVIHENVVFATQLKGDKVTITPYQILNSRNCSLVLDNRNGVVEYLNAWEQRQPVPLYGSPELEPSDAVQAAYAEYKKHKPGSFEASSWDQKMITDAAQPLFENSLELIGEGNVQSASERLHQALMLDPRGTTHRVFSYWQKHLSKDTTSELLEASHDPLLHMLLAYDEARSQIVPGDEHRAKQVLSKFISRYQATLRREKFVDPYAIMVMLCAETLDDDDFNYYVQQGNLIDPGFENRLLAGQWQPGKEEDLWSRIKSWHIAALFYEVGQDLDSAVTALEQAIQYVASGNTNRAISELETPLNTPSADEVYDDSLLNDLKKAQETARQIASELRKRPRDFATRGQIVSDLLGLKTDYLMLAKTAYENAGGRNTRFSEVDQSLASALFKLGSYRQAVDVMFQAERPLSLLSSDVNIEILDFEKTTYQTIVSRIEKDTIYVTAYDELPTHVIVVRDSSIVDQYGVPFLDVEEGRTYDSITSSGNYWYISDWSILGISMLLPKRDAEVVLPDDAVGVDLLRITGVSKEDLETVARGLSFVSDPRFVDFIPTGLSSEGESLVENLLNTNFPLPPSIGRFLEVVQSVDPLLLKCMVYGYIPPVGAESPTKPVFEVAAIEDLSVGCTVMGRDTYLQKPIVEMTNHYGEPPRILKEWPERAQ